MQREERKFGEVVRDLRMQQRISLRKFADLVDISGAFVSMMENGKVNPPGEEKIKKMADILGANRDELLALARKISTDLQEIIWEEPEVMADYLRCVKKAPMSKRRRWKEFLKDC